MATIARALPGQQRALFASREELLDRRDRRVLDTVVFAAEHVPYYRDLFRAEQIDPGDIRGAADLAELPIVSREELLPDSRRFRSDGVDARDGLELQSTGTTGAPLTVLHDRHSVLLNIAYAERERAVESALVGRRLRYTRLYLGSEYPENVDRVRGLMAQSSFRPLRPRFRRATLAGPPESVDRTIDAIRPDIILGCGSHLESFYRAAAGRGEGPEHRPKAILYTWDHMSAGGRKLIEDHFGIPVLSRYSAMESLKIGFFCEQREGFHLHEDLCHLTVVDRDGKAVPDGESGEIVISNLVNRGSVLLNYRIGDLGRISANQCSCGRTSRVLAELEGRVSEYVTLPDGSFVGPFLVTLAVNRLPGVLRFQLVQQAAGSFELLLAMTDRAAFDHIAASAASDVAELLRGYEVEPRYVEEIPVEPGQKYRPIVLLEQP
jgi:phenylacetate-coenzyme A ligase PaaK-like adenylate-forming protein